MFGIISIGCSPVDVSIGYGDYNSFATNIYIYITAHFHSNPSKNNSISFGVLKYPSKLESTSDRNAERLHVLIVTSDSDVLSQSTLATNCAWVAFCAANTVVAMIPAELGAVGRTQCVSK